MVSSKQIYKIKTISKLSSSLARRSLSKFIKRFDTVSNEANWKNYYTLFHHNECECVNLPIHSYELNNVRARAYRHFNSEMLLSTALLLYVFVFFFVPFLVNLDYNNNFYCERRTHERAYAFLLVHFGRNKNENSLYE